MLLEDEHELLLLSLFLHLLLFLPLVLLSFFPFFFFVWYFCSLLCLFFFFLAVFNWVLSLKEGCYILCLFAVVKGFPHTSSTTQPTWILPLTLS